MPTQSTLSASFLSDNEQELILRCANLVVPKHGVTVRVSPLNRVGFSGARLYLCYIGSGLPYVIKLGPAKGIKSEFKAMKSVTHAFADSDCPLKQIPTVIDDGGKIGAIVYRHRGGHSRTQIRQSKELREVLLAKDSSSSEAETLLEKVYSRVGSAQDEGRFGQVRLYSHYNWYLRNDDSAPVIKSILGKRATLNSFSLLGAETYNPLMLMNRLKRGHTIETFIAPTHGDLHANNVIVDSDNQVHLIDFAWAKPEGPALVDYVLMECSLRFLLFPKHVDLRTQLQVDLALLDRHGHEKLEELTLDTPLSESYGRLGRMIGVIRKSASKIIDGSEQGFNGYLWAQFMVLYGLLKYDTFNLYTATRALALLSTHLSKELKDA